MAKTALNCFSTEELKCPVIWSMCEHLKDVYNAQGEWVWPRWRDGKIIRFRIKQPTLTLEELEKAPF